MISPEQLLRVSALGEHRHFGRAASVLGITQPALSRSIRDLEQRLDARLFDRGRGGVEPTVFGTLLLERGAEIVQSIRELEREIATLRGVETGSLTVAFGPYPHALCGHRALAHIVAKSPLLKCTVRVMGWPAVTKQVLAGEVDLGVADLDEARGDSRLAVESLGALPLYFLCRPDHPVATLPRARLDDLLDHPWAGTAIPSQLRRRLSPAVGRKALRDGDPVADKPAIELDVVSHLGELAAHSQVLVASPLTLVEPDLAAGRLSVVDFTAPWLRLDYGVITRSGRTPSPATAQMISILRQVEEEMETQESALRERHAPSRSR